MKTRKLKIYSDGEYMSTEDVAMESDGEGSFTISYPLDECGEYLANELPEMADVIDFKEMYSGTRDVISYRVKVRVDEPDSADVISRIQALTVPLDERLFQDPHAIPPIFPEGIKKWMDEIDE